MDYRQQGKILSLKIIAELKQIRSRDDLLVHAPKLEELFNRLADVIIQAEVFKDNHPEASIENPLDKEHGEPDRLRVELNRVLHMEGGREVIERVQETALNRLDAFEKERLKGQRKGIIEAHLIRC